MPSLTCPEAVRKVTDRFKSTQPMSYPVLCALFALHVTGCRSMCDLVRQNGWASSVSSLDRGLQSFQANRFMRRLRGGVLRRLGPDMDGERYCFAVDDTLVRRYGDEIFRRGCHGQHGKGGVMWGQRIMVLALVDKERGVAIPLAFSMCLNKDREGYVSGHDLCFGLVKEVVAAGFPELPTVVDSWFDSVALLKKFSDRGWTLIWECKQNRKVKRIPSPKAKWMSWKEALHRETKVSVKLAKTQHSKRTRRTKYVASRRVLIRGHGAQVMACAVYNKPSDGKCFAIYASNNLSLNGADLWEHARARWHIEEMFRSLKQSLGFLTLPVRGESACYASICIPFALKVSLDLEPETWGGTPKMPLGQIVREFRAHLMWETFDRLADGRKRLSILKLQKRRLCNENRKKPTDPTADEVEAYFGQAS